MKKYKFVVNRGGENIYKTVPEDKLNKRHIDLLLGELLIKFNNSPKTVQEKFISQITQ